MNERGADLSIAVRQVILFSQTVHLGAAYSMGCTRNLEMLPFFTCERSQ